MPTLELDLPTEIFSALRRTPRELGPELRMAAAIHWYSKGRISQERASQLVGLDRTDFLMALAREGGGWMRSWWTWIRCGGSWWRRMVEGTGMVDPEIVTTVRTYLEKVRSHGIPVELGVLFGSWSRGQASPLSDIDLLVRRVACQAPICLVDCSSPHGRSSHIHASCSDRPYGVSLTYYRQGTLLRSKEG